MTTLTVTDCDLQLDYCQFLLASHTNYTQTYFAEHTQKWSHDQINRYLRNETISPRQVWENVKDDICFSNNGYLYSTGETQKHCSTRFEIEQFYRQIKQVTGLKRCQCRKQRAVRNHIGCAMLVWVQLNRVARLTGQTIYQLKETLLDDYLSQQLLSPTIQMTLA